MRNSLCVSTHTSPGAVPEWDLHDRMRKSLRHAGLDNAGIAERLGVDPATVSRWLTGKQTITDRTLRAWAMGTGVDYQWLALGAGPSGGDGEVVDSAMPSAALAQSAERFTRNDEWNASPRFCRSPHAA